MPCLQRFFAAETQSTQAKDAFIEVRAVNQIYVDSHPPYLIPGCACYLHMVRCRTQPPNDVFKYEQKICISARQHTIRPTRVCLPVQPPVTVYGIPGRYASALYSAAVKADALERVEAELTEV